MPHPAVSITIGVLAATAITAIVAKEIIENLDELHDKYDAFADTVERDHDVRLPRFRRREQYYSAYNTGPSASPFYGSRSNDAQSHDAAQSQESARRDNASSSSAQSDSYQSKDLNQPDDAKSPRIEHSTGTSEVDHEEWSDTWTLTDGDTETWSNSDFNELSS